jgi:hypothetical protein
LGGGTRRLRIQGVYSDSRGYGNGKGRDGSIAQDGFDLRGQASFASTFVSSLDMLAVVILLPVRGARSLFPVSNASARVLIALFDSW